MKSSIAVVFLICMNAFLLSCQSLAERLGYSPNDRLLIIHADDLGVAHSENIASFLALKTGPVNSASIMMPTPWVAEVAEFKQKNPEMDFGLHLTLTNEWRIMNWGPVASKDKVSTIVNDLGFFYSNCLDFGKEADPAEAEFELRAQVQKAIDMGLAPTHLDTHMGCLLFNSPELFGAYLKIGREFKIPVMVPRLFIQAASPAFKSKMSPEDAIIENVYMASESDYESGMAKFYEKTLKNIGAGVNVLLVHLGINNAEMQALTIDHEPYGARWRQEDFDFFTSSRASEIIKQEGIILVQWRDIQKLLYP